MIFLKLCQCHGFQVQETLLTSVPRQESPFLWSTQQTMTTGFPCPTFSAGSPTVKTRATGTPPSSGLSPSLSWVSPHAENTLFRHTFHFPTVLLLCFSSECCNSIHSLWHRLHLWGIISKRIKTVSVHFHLFLNRQRLLSWGILLIETHKMGTINYF